MTVFRHGSLSALEHGHQRGDTGLPDLSVLSGRPSSLEEDSAASLLKRNFEAPQLGVVNALDEEPAPASESK